MPRENKYPPNSYGAYLEELTGQLNKSFKKLTELTQKPGFYRTYREHNEKLNFDKNYAKVDYPADVKTEMDLHEDVTTTINQMRLVHDKMIGEDKDLNGEMPPEERHHSWKDEIRDEAKEKGGSFSDSEFFKPHNLDTMKVLLHLGGDEPPKPTQLIGAYAKMKGEVFKTMETIREERKAAKEQEREERQKPAGELVNRLKQSTQKSFVGKLKSFFVGNSKEYDAALKGVESLADGTGDPKQVKEVITKYLDLRGNKVRDHEYGRERFDAMLSSLALVTTPREFERYCQKIDDARDLRTNGSYSRNGGRIDPEKYMTAAQREKAKNDPIARRDDIEAIKADAQANMGRANYEFFDALKGLKDPKNRDPKMLGRIRDYMEEHPCVRDAAREIVEENHLNIKVPKTPENLGDDVAYKLREQEKEARTMAGLEPKEPQRERNEPQREQQGPQRQMRGGPDA